MSFVAFGVEFSGLVWAATGKFHLHVRRPFEKGACESGADIAGTPFYNRKVIGNIPARGGIDVLLSQVWMKIRYSVIKFGDGEEN